MPKAKNSVAPAEDTAEEVTNQPVTETTTTSEEPEKKSSIILRDTYGNDVDQNEYFFSKSGKKNTAPSYFNTSCGYPVEREDMLEVFNRIFKKRGFLFYKDSRKEVYLVIVPLKNSVAVSKKNDSQDGDFQRHAISFINEGGVNLDTLEMRLNRIASNNFIKRDE